MGRKRLLAAGCAVLAMGAAPAEPARHPRGASARAIGEEITVTATRRASAISRVPISITAFTQASLDAKGARDISDVARFTPGVSFDPVTNNISVRGISSEAGAGTTGLYIDDTPIQIRNLGFNAENTLPELFDLQRVEILRGPQGTLFGAGSEGGTVRYITPPPGLEDYSSYARASVSASPDGAPSYDLGDAIGGPILPDVLGFRASVSHAFDGGYLDHVSQTTGQTTARDTNSVDTTTFRGTLAWRPVDTLTVTPSLFYQQRLKGDYDSYFAGLSNPGTGAFRTNSPDFVRDNDRFYLPSLDVQWNLSGLTLISTTSYLHRNNLTGYDGTVYDLSYYNTLLPTTSPYYPLLLPTGINPDVAFYNSPNKVINQQRDFTQELRLQSDDAAARFAWVTGAFYEHSQQFSSESLADPHADELFEDLFGETIADYFGAPLYDGDSYIDRTSALDKQIAVFANGTWHLGGGVTLDGGLRYAHTSFSFVNFADGSQNGGQTGGAGGTAENPVTGKISLSWQITPRDMVYAGFARGYRVGGANAPVPASVCGEDFANFGIAAAPQSYASDTVDSFEIGAKDRLFGGKLQLAISAFSIDWSHIQQDVLLPICGIQYTANLGEAVSRGFDAQATMRPLPNVTLDTSVSFTDAHYTTDATAGSSSAGAVALPGDTIGDPAWKFAIGAQYDIPTGLFSPYGATAYLREDYQYIGKQAGTTPLRDPRSVSYDPGYGPFQATNDLSVRAGLAFPDGLNVSVFVNNALNATPSLSHLHETYGSLLYYNTTLRPLYAGVEMTFRG